MSNALQNIRSFAIRGVVLFTMASAAFADWPMLRGTPQHTGYVETQLQPPFRLAWAAEFFEERLGTALEPIVSGDRVFITTHAGNVYALHAERGDPLWRFQAHGPFLHAPAVSDDIVVAASADGFIYGLEAASGKLIWSRFGGVGGFSAAPVIANAVIFIGSRAGDFFAVRVSDGTLLWRQTFSVSIRQTAAVDEGKVFVTPEDLRVRCLDAGSGKLLWVSEAFPGQTARDYYPVVAPAGNRKLLVVRTNPIRKMSQQIARDRRVLAQNAGLDDSRWQNIDAWTKSERTRGSPELWAKEQAVVLRHLDEHADARTFHLLDARTGESVDRAPVLWIAGCQAAGSPPTLLADGRWLLFNRSAYGNWNLGVAPLVALQLFNPVGNTTTPLFHAHGSQPPWNTFWGTADESQNFVVAGQTVLIVHQGTLSGFNLGASNLFTIRGERDTYGGFRAPPWARNEWHGPARGGVAISKQKIFWITGSRLLCLRAGESGQAAELRRVTAADLPSVSAPPKPAPAAMDRARLEHALIEQVEQLISRRWAPLYVEPGLSGREFFFDDSGETFAALAQAFSHLPGELQERVKRFLAEQWEKHPPFSRAAWYALNEGARRERFPVAPDLLSRLGQDKPHHPFGNVAEAWQYAERCGERDRVLAAWPEMKAAFADFEKSNWQLDLEKGDLHAHRYWASAMAAAKMAELSEDADTSKRITAWAAELQTAIETWWHRSAERLAFPVFKGSAELDPFIGKGDALYFAIAPHRHKVALLRDVSGVEFLQRLRLETREAIWRGFTRLNATWSLTGEERQVHFGENFVDPPDLAFHAFAAMAVLGKEDMDAHQLAAKVDLPWCAADLFFIRKVALTLESMRQLR
ncbi:MAG: PQQ-binding-like beta-propeller repeat protein [Verrucomicrobiota bacterium]